MSDAINPETLFFIVKDDIGNFSAVEASVVVNNVVAEMVDIKIIKNIVGLQKIMSNVVNVESFGIKKFT